MEKGKETGQQLKITIMEDYMPKVGDKVRITKSIHNWNIYMDQFVGCVYEIDNVNILSRKGIKKYSVKFKGNPSNINDWEWTVGQGHFEPVESVSKETVDFREGEWIWLTGSDGSKALVLWSSGPKTGINFGGDWSTNIGGMHKTQRATNEEVYTALKKEAEKRDLWDVPIYDAEDSKKRRPITMFGQYYDISSDRLWSRYGVVYYKGKWATKLKDKEGDKKNSTTKTPTPDNSKEETTPTKFEEGDWIIKIKGSSYEYFMKYSSTGDVTGWYDGEFRSNFWSMGVIDNFIKATEDEVLERFVKEARKRYSRKAIKCLHDCETGYLKKIKRWTFEEDCLRYETDTGVGCAYESGEWAEGKPYIMDSAGYTTVKGSTITGFQTSGATMMYNPLDTGSILEEIPMSYFTGKKELVHQSPVTRPKKEKRKKLSVVNQ